MVSLKQVEESNRALQDGPPGQVSLWVGATSGLGLATLRNYTRHAREPKAYVLGRNAGKLRAIVSELRLINKEGHFQPLVAEFGLFKQVDAACEQFRSREQSLDLLCMSPGYLKVTRLRMHLFPAYA